MLKQALSSNRRFTGRLRICELSRDKADRISSMMFSILSLSEAIMVNGLTFSLDANTKYYYME
ncbi:MAG: hypothetical protein ACYSSL_02410 [Planctomycetota bacterium]